MVRVKVEHEVRAFDPQATDGWQLAFQWCRYVNQDDGSLDHGYRFIWVRHGKLQPARGQARLPSLNLIRELIAKAEAEGWGDHDGNQIDTPDQTRQEQATRKAVRAAARRGRLRWNGGKPTGLRGVSIRGGPISDTIIEDRG